MTGLSFLKSFFVVLVIAFLPLSASGSIVKNVLPEHTSLIPPNTLLAKSADPAVTKKPIVYDLKKWTVEEKVEAITKSLQVYQPKFETLYNRQVWLTDRKDGTRRLAAQYTSRRMDDKLLFSANENFLYYSAVTPTGQNKVYGVNLTTDQRFPLGAGQDFDTMTCPNQEGYVVIHADYDKTVYRVFSSAGRSFKTLVNIHDPAVIEKKLCY